MNNTPYSEYTKNNIEAPAIQADTPNFSYKLPKDPVGAIEEMMSIIDDMCSVYARETDVLKAANSQDFMAMQDETLQTAARYQDAMQQMILRKDEIKNIDPVYKNKLNDMQKDFSVIAKKNLDALERMQRCVGRIGNKIREAAQDVAKKERTVSYGAHGMVSDPRHKGVSMGINETA